MRERVTTEAIRAISPESEQVFLGLSGKQIRSARSLCNYWNRVEGDESGLFVSLSVDQYDRSRITIRKKKV